MSGVVRIDGEGVAACCAAYLLGAGQLPGDGSRPQLSAILLSESTQSLLADVFDNPELFRGLHRIGRRIVAWGQNEPTELPHSAVAVSEQVLLERLRSGLSMVNDQAGAADWRIVASKQHHPLAFEEHFGSRIASITAARLSPASPDDACWIESVANGWLFLLGLGEGEASLISVGASPQSMLDGSRLVGPCIAYLSHEGSSVPAHPRICPALCGPGWLACGSAAMSFDPVCGDGAGNAVREAILASAVVRGAIAGVDPSPLLAHYSTRLTSAFLRHLETCLQFYNLARSGQWWDGEIHLLEQGIAWCRASLIAAPPYRHRLVGFDLLPL